MLYAAGNRGHDDRGTMTIAYVILNNQHRSDTSLLGAAYRFKIRIEYVSAVCGVDIVIIHGIWQSNDVYFVVIYYAIPAYYPELELQIVFLSGFNANHLYKAKSRKAWIIHRCLAVSLYLQMCYFREWSLTGQPTNIADDEH